MSALATKLITAEEFAELPDPEDGSKQELVRGEIVETPLTKQIHGLVQAQIVWLLKSAVMPEQLGWVGSESGVITERDPDTVRGPDVYFFSRTRFPERPEGWADGAPDLAVEILSPSNSRSSMRAKVAEYVTAGAKIVWVVDPESKTVMVYSGTLRGVELGEAETIDGGSLLPDFSCKVADFFAD
jgi:Uma2 family endonuclease